MNIFKNVLKRDRKAAKAAHRDASRSPQPRMPVELSAEEREIVHYIKDRNLTMTSYERLWTTLMACKHVMDRDISGAFVECGVWRGGNALLAAWVFRMHGANRRVYLLDTFQGMTAPTERDKRVADGSSARAIFLQNQKITHNEWCYASLEDVKNNFAEAGLLSDNVTFVQGDVCKTLEDERNLPHRISVLRLDTDWYESTKKELDILYPRLSVGGALLIDDYGHWAGAKEATDEYFHLHNNRPFLQYVDYTGRAAVKIA